MCRARRPRGWLVGGIKPGFARSAPPGALFRVIEGLPWICTRGTQTADSLPRRRGLQRGSAWISVHAAITLNSRRHCILPSIMVTRRFIAALALSTASAKVFFEGELSFGTRARARRRSRAAALVHTSASSTRAKCCNAKPSHCHLRATTAATRPCAQHTPPPHDAARRHRRAREMRTPDPHAPRPRDAQRPSTRTSASAGRYRNGRTPTLLGNGSTRPGNGSSSRPRRRPTACRRRRT